MREIRTLRVMWRELETGLGTHVPVTAPVPDPTVVPGLVGWAFLLLPLDARLLMVARVSGSR